MFQNLSITFQEKQWPFVVRIQASPCSEADPVNPGWEGIRGLCCLTVSPAGKLFSFRANHPAAGTLSNNWLNPQATLFKKAHS